jgi:hypothetical protein
MIKTRTQRITERLDIVPFGHGSLDPIVCEQEVFLEPPIEEEDEPVVIRRIPKEFPDVKPSYAEPPPKHRLPTRTDLDIIRVSNFSEDTEPYRIQWLFMNRFHHPIRNIFVSDCRRFAFVHLFSRKHADTFYEQFLRFPFQNQVLETKRMYTT